jgi:hypothetical protein
LKHQRHYVPGSFGTSCGGLSTGRLLLLLLSLPVFALSGCDRQSEDRLPESREYDVYSALIQQWVFKRDEREPAAVRTPPGAVKLLVIRDRTSLGAVPESNPGELVGRLRVAVPANLAERFVAANAKPVRLESKFNVAVTVVLISEAEERNVFGKSIGEGW